MLAVERQLTGEMWITAGAAALTLGEAIELLAELGHELGVANDPVRFVPPDVFDRLFAPVFLDALPTGLQRSVVKLLEFFGAYLAVDEPLPSDLDVLTEHGLDPLGDLRESFMASLRYWAQATGRSITPEANAS
jgi:hypothetical protein